MSAEEWVSAVVLAAVLIALFVMGVRGETRARERRARLRRRAQLARHRRRLIAGQKAARQLGVEEPEWGAIVELLTADREDA